MNKSKSDTAGIFTYEARVQFHHCDPAGILFFGKAFELAHDALEEFVRSSDIPWKSWFDHPAWAAPLRSAKAEYLIPIPTGTLVQIQLSKLKLGGSSLTFEFCFVVEGKAHLEICLVPVFISKESKSAIPIPAEIRAALEKQISP